MTINLKKELALKNYNIACNRLLKVFITEYFSEDDETIDEIINDRTFWVADECGGIVCINEDFFIGLNDIIIALKLNYPRDLFFEWYDYSIEPNGNQNLKTYLTLKGKCTK